MRLYLLELGRNYEAGTRVRVFRKRDRAEGVALTDYGVTIVSLDDKHDLPDDKRRTAGYYDHVTLMEVETE